MACLSSYPFDSHYVSVKGYKLHYLTYGEGPPVIFLHGNPTWSYLWRNVIQSIGSDYRCFAPDLVGFGHSEKSQQGLKYAQQFEILHQWWQKHFFEKPVLVGHDWGGVIATDLARYYPGHINGLVLMETFPFSLTFQDIMPEYRLFFHLLRVKGIRKLFMGYMNLLLQAFPYFVQKKLSNEVLTCYRHSFESKGSTAIYALFDDLPLWGNSTAPFHTLEQFLYSTSLPILWLQTIPGLLNRPSRVRQLKKEAQNMEVRNVGHGGHFVPEEQPEFIAQSIRNFLRDKRG